MINNKIKKQLEKLPKTPGVYLYYDIRGKLIYIGKTTVLKHRVRSYFIGIHDNKTEKLISEIANIKWRETRSTIEALILESNLIKKYQPKYNIREKDDKSFVQIGITDEKFPRVISYRPTQKEKINTSIKKIYGPYTNNTAVKQIIEIFRKIFKFRDCSDYKFARFSKINKPCINYNINLCTGPCAKLINQIEYNKSIKQIQMMLKGNTKKAISVMKKQMQQYSKNEEFEKAKEIRDRIDAFMHLSDIAAIKHDRPLEQIKSIPHRIEAYDISNMGKNYAVGSMVVFIDGEIKKTEYRKFRIINESIARKHPKIPEKFTRNSSRFYSNNKNLRSMLYDLRPNDPAMMAQVIERRLAHPEWEKPNLILLDGGKEQLSVVLNKLRTLNIKLPVMAIAKGPTRKGFTLFKNSLAKKIKLDRKFIEFMRDEAHRFAITYHRKLRRKSIVEI